MGHCPDITRAEVAKLREAGIEPTLDELAELVLLGKRVENPRCNLPVTVEPEPLYLADRVLWPLTLQAEEWLAVMGPQFAGVPGLCAVCYAAEHSRETGAFSELYTIGAAAEAVRQWRRSCGATAEEIAAAAERLVGEPSRPEPQPRGSETPDLSRVLADLFAATGQPPEYWLTRCSQHMLDVLRAVMRRDLAAMGDPRRAPDDSGAALRAFGLAVDAVRKRAAACHK